MSSLRQHSRCMSPFLRIYELLVAVEGETFSLVVYLLVSCLYCRGLALTHGRLGWTHSFCLLLMPCLGVINICSSISRKKLM